MLLASNLKTSRFLRLVALVIPSVLFFLIWHVGWEPLYRSLSTPKTAAAADPNSNSDVPPEELLSGNTESHLPVSDAHSGSATFVDDTIGSFSTAIHGVPDKIWHSAKGNNLTDDQRGWLNSWTEKNPSFRQELMTDRSSEAFVRTQFHKTRPDIVEVYEALPIPILRADLLRYLMVLAEGGIWSDLDVTCEKQVADWVPQEYKDRDIDIIVGLEFDFAWRGPGTQVASQFCNWVFTARPSSRNLQVIVDSVVNKVKEVAYANGIPIEYLTLEMLPDVVDVTGPKIMTIAILRSLSQLLDRAVDDRDFSGIKQPKLIGDVLIMPGNAFAASQNGWPTDQADALVTHHYEGSWKQADVEAKERKRQKQQQMNAEGSEA